MARNQKNDPKSRIFEDRFQIKFMKILLRYLKPYRWLVVLTLVLATFNTGFSLMDPIIFGRLVGLATDFKYNTGAYGSTGDYFWSFSTKYPGVVFLLLCSIGVAMIS